MLHDSLGGVGTDPQLRVKVWSFVARYSPSLSNTTGRNTANVIVIFMLNFARLIIKTRFTKIYLWITCGKPHCPIKCNILYAVVLHTPNSCFVHCFTCVCILIEVLNPPKHPSILHWSLPGQPRNVISPVNMTKNTKPMRRQAGILVRCLNYL